MRSVKSSLAVASLGVFIASASCTLITDVDRSKIPSTDAGTPSGEGGDNTPGAGGEAGTTPSAGAGNSDNSAGAGGTAGVAGEAGGPSGGAPDDSAGAAGTAGSH